MASIANGSNGGGLTLPTWFLAAATGAFLTVSVAIGGAAIMTWAKANDAADANKIQDDRLDRLEQLQIDVAGMKADTAATRDLARSTNDKLDRLIDRELGRRP